MIRQSERASVKRSVCKGIVILAGLSLAVMLLRIVVVPAFATHPVLRTTWLGKMARWHSGEPGATQDVNEAVDKIISSGWDKEFIELYVQFVTDFASEYESLEGINDHFGNGWLLPLDLVLKGESYTRILEIKDLREEPSNHSLASPVVI